MGKQLDLNKMHLLYNAAAHLNAVKAYPEGLIAAMDLENEGGLKAICWAVAELSTRGELVRRMQGFDKEELWTAEEVEAVISPFQMVQAKGMVIQAILHGMSTPNSQHEEVDEVLAEIEKKTAMA